MLGNKVKVKHFGEIEKEKAINLKGRSFSFAGSVIEIREVNMAIFHTPKVWKVKSKWVWPTRFILFLVSIYFLYKSYSAVTSGFFYSNRQYYYMNQDPIFFWLITTMFVIVAIGAIWQAFRVKKIET